jgi:hypothetical protein
MPALIHPATGEPITLAPGEQLQRICWHGAPVLVVTATRATARAPGGELLYRLARPSCQTWNPVDRLPLEPWPLTSTSQNAGPC